MGFQFFHISIHNVSRLAIFNSALNMQSIYTNQGGLTVG